MTTSMLSSRLCPILSVVLLTAAWGVPARARSARQPPDTLRNLVYGKAGGEALKLDLYLPETGGDPRPKPVIVFVHGGGWRIGGKSEVEPYTALLTTAGYAVASVDYRLSGRHRRFPTQIFDCKTAVRWVRANAARYGIDPARIGALGYSAGGHLAALLGTSEGVKALEDRSEGSPDASSRVQAICSVSGPVDLTFPPESLIGKYSIDGLLGGTAREHPERARSGNPALYATHGDAPALLIYGDKDTLVPPIHARILSEALRKVGVEVQVVVVHGGGHVPFYDQEQQTALEFFGRHLSRQ